ncbi:hypothetical protein ACFQ1S_17435 [Kibdelosporangium lantanae]|uniref:Uncharacterized protein n=1 Tax=Kibdelosporangium lantanae TaxID=1497396 RepID=A0ABW3MB12_9PSEU
MFITRLPGEAIGEKRRWPQYKARVRQQPPNHRADLFEQAARAEGAR